MIVAILMAAFTITGCKKDDEPEEVPVTKTALQTKISEAQTLHDAAEEGTAQGQYQFGAKTVLQQSINLAKTVADNAEATQIMVDNAVIALEQAITTFDGKK